MGNKKTILVVDDEPELRNVLAIRLSSGGYEVIESGNGKEAIKIAKEKKPNLIILDIMMPEMDGMSMSQQLKESLATKDIPIIFLTGLVDKETESPELGSGKNIIFAKPYDAHELMATVERLIGK